MRSQNNLGSLGSPRGFGEQRNKGKYGREQRKMNPLGAPNLIRSQTRQLNFDTRQHNLCHPVSSHCDLIGCQRLNFQ